MSEETKSRMETDPYGYLERDDFTSEKYKIEVRGLPKYYGIGEFKKLLNEKLQLQTCKVKPPSSSKRGSSWLYVSFRSEESRKRAIQVINGTVWKNSKLTAQAAMPAPDPFVKRKMVDDSSNKRLKTAADDDGLSPMERVRSTTTPLWDVPYSDQLELKQKEMRNVLKNLCFQMIKESRGPLLDWINKQKGLYDGLPCELLPILSAEKVEGYRNKCEFTIGRSVDGARITIGFRISSYAAGSTAVGPIDDLCHIPERMKTAVKIFEEFVQNSGLEAFNPVDHSGHWKQVTARTAELHSDLMFIVAVHPQDMSPEKLEELRDRLKEFFETGKGAEAGVTSLYFQTLDRKGAGGESRDSLWHVSGKKYIEERLFDMKFRVSPQAFFQINAQGAQVLYKAAMDLAELNADTTLLDICCGTGTIGLTFSKHCGEVFGMEMVEDAIKDARENAIANEVTNCEFFVGKAEDVLAPVIRRATKPNIIALVDPPRAGLHQRALLTLRKARTLSKLVYVSCDPRAATKNLVDLARPTSKQYTGDPLVPVKAVAVDMFPYTRHCELILCLERLSEAMKASNSETTENNPVLKDQTNI